MPEDDSSLSREHLLWEPDAVAHFLARDATHQRFRDRSHSGVPTLSAQTYASVTALLHLRAIPPDRIALSLEELLEFRVAQFDRRLAEAYAAAYPRCLNSARNREAAGPPEPWFIWQVALNHLYGCRILTNDRARYAGIVAHEDIV